MPLALYQIHQSKAPEEDGQHKVLKPTVLGSTEYSTKSVGQFRLKRDPVHGRDVRISSTVIKHGPGLNDPGNNGVPCTV